MNPGGYDYVAIASFDETSSGPSVSGVIELHFPINPLSDGRSYLEDSEPHVLTLVARAAESPPHLLVCRLELDESGKLRLNRV